MKLNQLEHILRAAGAITQENRIVVVGSQAILGTVANPPEALVLSIEADIYPLDDPNKSDLIDGTIGEMSPFHELFGYYAHGVGPLTATLPADWLERSARIANDNTRGIEGICPGAADLAVSKLAAGRPKDFDFVALMLKCGFVREHEITSCMKKLAGGLHEIITERLNRAMTNSRESY